MSTTIWSGFLNNFNLPFAFWCFCLTLIVIFFLRYFLHTRHYQVFGFYTSLSLNNMILQRSWGKYSTKLWEPRERWLLRVQLQLAANTWEIRYKGSEGTCCYCLLYPNVINRISIFVKIRTYSLISRLHTCLYIRFDVIQIIDGKF